MKATGVENDLENDVVAIAIRKLMESSIANTGTRVWIGTSSALLDALTTNAVSQSTVRSPAWPNSAEKIGQRLRRLEVPFAEIGISIIKTASAAAGKGSG